MTAKYDSIGLNYNKTRKADPFIAECLFTNLNPKADGVYLDIGCGTGNYTNALQKKGFRFIGIDPSNKMLERAKLKNPNIDWRQGQAENTKIKPNSIDGIMASLTIHHWKDFEQGFSELYSILKPNGTIVIFTSTPKQMKGYWLNHYFPKMLEDSMTQMPSLKTIENVMNHSGFLISKTEIYNVKPDLKDLFLYCGKHNPKLYLSPKIRQGISSFSSLANTTEVETGLIELHKDIANNTIQKIINSFKNDLGDYLFIIGKKPLDSI
ncbi:hypothetical protein GCM10023311_28520 [Flaviramulus aquimarinus]|uniref:Methyltransferase type 11 domain-containing protein n=1 Tax=Flaviramulus aquimarinus TaxID=1170456 RepID=A0ABP9FLX3_9FLAO